MKPSDRNTDTSSRTGRVQVRRRSSTSLASLFSSLITTSGGSSGSTSTVTQESMPRPRTRSSKPPASSPKAGSKSRSVSNSRRKIEGTLNDPTMVPPPVPDVFQFLDAEQSSTNLVASTGVLPDPTTPIAASPNQPSDEPQKDGLNNSFHSDSGISMPESSSEKEDVVEDQGSSGKQLKTKAQDRAISVKRRARPPPNRVRPRLDETRVRAIDDENFEDLPYPEAFYLRGGYSTTIPPIAPQPPSNINTDVEEISEASETESGYDLLASKLSTSTIPPVYRKFVRLNHRILLHLQDEISEMEEELQYLDEAESQCRAAEAHASGRAIAPASRRVMSRSQRHNDIFFRRLDLLGRLSIKVDQYNRTLCSFHKVDRSLPAAGERDVTSYRSWLDTHLPIALPETHFLDHDDDLVTIARTSFGLNTDSATAHFLIAVIATAIVLPLLAFSAIPQFFGRIIVLGIVGVAVTLFLGSSRVAGMLSPEEVWKCGAVYFLTMTLAALMIS